MTFTELALLVWAIAASVVATHYRGRFRAANNIVGMAAIMQVSMIEDPAVYEKLRAKYLHAIATGERP